MMDAKRPSNSFVPDTESKRQAVPEYQDNPANVDFIACLEIELFHQRGRQPDRPAVTPFGNVHFLAVHGSTISEL